MKKNKKKIFGLRYLEKAKKAKMGRSSVPIRPIGPSGDPNCDITKVLPYLCDSESEPDFEGG